MVTFSATPAVGFALPLVMTRCSGMNVAVTGFDACVIATALMRAVTIAVPDDVDVSDAVYVPLPAVANVVRDAVAAVPDRVASMPEPTPVVVLLSNWSFS